MRVVPACVATLLLLSWSAALSAADPTSTEPFAGREIPLWPGDAPGSEGLTLKERIVERSDRPPHHDRYATGILRPSLGVFRPAEPNGTAVVVVPGGAYQRVVIDKEGLDIAEWLNRLGVTAFVLKYRLPEAGHAAPGDVPLQDGQRAMRIVRSRAGELGIDPGRIGAIGFSAGGHLAGALAAYQDSRVYPPVDEADRSSSRPDFVILAYPVVGPELVQPDALARMPELRLVVSAHSLVEGVSGAWPPTFLLHAADDATIRAEGSIRLFQALRTRGVPAELHVFQSGGHGFGITQAEGPVARWPMLCGEWLHHQGLLGPP